MEVESQVWHSFLDGEMVRLPALNTDAYYFPQGHAELAAGPVDFERCPARLSSVLCRVSSFVFTAQVETDQLCLKIQLSPASGRKPDDDQEYEAVERLATFKKNLSRSDVTSTFVVPKSWAENLLPALEEGGTQSVPVKDVHGKIWQFKHHRSPSRHTFSAGWREFAVEKRVIVGDCIVFVRAQTGDLCVWIQRNQRIDVNLDPGSVMEATTLSARGLPFQVVYYPRAAGASEFCIVDASAVDRALQILWIPAMKVKSISEPRSIGTVLSTNGVDRRTWPNSNWRLLQIQWDGMHSLQNVSPWLVECVVDQPPLKKQRLLDLTSVASTSTATVPGTLKLFGQTIVVGEQTKEAEERCRDT